LDLIVRWTAFPLHPETPDEGRTLEEMFAGRGLDIPAMLARLKYTAAGLGLPFTERSMTFNSRSAQELGKWAEAMGAGDRFHRLVFEAYFAHGRNIAQWAVLADIVTAAGLDPETAEQVLQQRGYSEAVGADWRRCRALGISAVPTFHMGGRLLVGAQPYEAIYNLALSAGAVPKRQPTEESD
jgi:predicted DsbA family dithiol-disulfide isomerase